MTENTVTAAVTNTRPGRPVTRVRWYTVATLFFLSFLTIVDRVCISAAKNHMAADLGISDIAFGWVFGAFALGYALFMLPSGWWADRIGPRRFLALIVVLWSGFTLSTGLIAGTASLIAVRFLFGAAEAGAYPTAARALYNWVPVSERGLSLGLLNTGSRLGAAVGLALMSYTVVAFGWRASFMLLAAVGFAWAAGWYVWFRDDPADKRGVSESELAYIRDGRPPAIRVQKGICWAALLGSRNTWLLLFQYFAGCFTVFICFTWLLPYLRSQYGLSAQQAGVYASFPLYGGAIATWASGSIVDRIYVAGRPTLSRLLPAMLGFGLAAAGLVSAVFMSTPESFILCFSLTAFGADLTLAPSWSAAADIGGKYTGTLSGAMNTFGSLGMFASSVSFPWLLELTGDVRSYFYLAAGINVAAVLCWAAVRPSCKLQS